MNAVDLASLLCSRLCHDLMSPVGALNNGIELLADEQDPEMREKCLELLADSARASANKLKFFRLAFGAGGGFGEAIDTSEAEAALQGLFGAERRIELGWIVSGGKLPKGAVKLLLNVALLAGDALVRGGRLDVGAEDNGDALELVIRAEHTFQRQSCFMRVDAVAEAAGGTEGQAEEFQLVGRRLGAVLEQLETLGTHLRVLLVGHQLDAVVKRPYRRHQVVAQARAEQAGKIDRVHRGFDAASSGTAQAAAGLNPPEPSPYPFQWPGGSRSSTCGSHPTTLAGASIGRLPRRFRPCRASG